MARLLNIVDENDQIISQKDHATIHREGLLHREVHVYFVTSKKEIIFQHRAKDKDTFPDLLDATVGGHVEIGEDYEAAAIKETWEETGLKINSADLIFVKKTKNRSLDKVTGKINYSFRKEYLYIYCGSLTDLKIEAGKALGFEAWPPEKLLSLNAAEKSRFIPVILDFVINDLADFIKDLSI